MSTSTDIYKRIAVGELPRKLLDIRIHASTPCPHCRQQFDNPEFIEWFKWALLPEEERKKVKRPDYTPLPECSHCHGTGRQVLYLSPREIKSLLELF